MWFFDETIFPFASMHPNAGARLRSEILLLPENLVNPGCNNCDSDLILFPESNNGFESTGVIGDQAGPTDPLFGTHMDMDHRYFLLSGNDNGTGYGVGSPAAPPCESTPGSPPDPAAVAPDIAASVAANSGVKPGGPTPIVSPASTPDPPASTPCAPSGPAPQSGGPSQPAPAQQADVL